MAKKKSVVPRMTPLHGAAICTSICELDRTRRYELAVEAFCQLSSAVLQRATRKEEAAPASLGKRQSADGLATRFDNTL